MKNDLFNQTLLRKYSKDFNLTPSKHDLIVKHIEKLEQGQFEAETKNYIYFYEVWLKGILGYDLEDNILFDEKEGEGRGKSEFILKSGDKKFMVVELKDQKTNLDKPQNRINDKRTPVDQAFDYAQHTGDIDWILVSNYNEFRLYNWHRKGHYISFTASELLDKTFFSYFMLSFSKKSYIDTNYIDRLMDKTVVIERELEKEFYKLYNETRLMLIKEFEEINKLSRLDSIHYAQMIMNRYMFICFAEDIDLLPAQISTDTILTPILKGNLRHGSIWQRLKELFLDIDEGNEYKKISQYNGGIFKEDLDHLKVRDVIEDQNFFKDVYQDWKFKEYEQDVNSNLGPYGQKVNPIYRNLLTIATFDFSTELDVNILGHIFENSIGDIEELKEGSKGRRKKDGIFYTPDYITDYICRNTIIPYLSKSGKVNTVDEVIQEYPGSKIKDLDLKVKEIKIIDPACGSGAFLNKAANVLLEIHESIREKLYTKNTLDHIWDPIEERREILLNNIYGVDLNEESVDITKLSLFLKVCRKGLILPNLDNNIKCGNSLIDDPEFTDKSFRWEEEFPEIFKEYGFDVVIGNPPYVRADSQDETFQKQRKWLKNSGQYETLYERWDLFIPFIEKGLKVLKKDGIISFIISNSYNSSKFADKSKENILKNHYFKKIDFFENMMVFKDAGIESVIITIEKTRKNSETQRILHSKSFNNTKELEPSNDLKTMFKINKGLNLSLNFKNTELLGDICYINYGMSLNSDEKKFIGEFKKDELISDIQTKINNKPYIEGKNLRRYRINQIRYLEWGSDRCPTKIRRATFPELYIYPKIIRGRMTEGVFDDTGLLCNESSFVIVLFNLLKDVHNRSIDNSIKKWTSKHREQLEEISLKFDIKYILAILNSKLAISYLNTIRRHRIEYYFYPDDLKNLPIKKISLELQKPFILKADELLKLNRSLQDEVNSFEDWLKYTFNIEKLSQKLEKYYELSFDDFLNEVKKKKVNVKSRKNYQILKEEFEKSIITINPLLQQIKESDNEIDQMVYELYGLTNEEIKIIEESLIK
jgi:type I restriction-modification system DNA methylase subunit